MDSSTVSDANTNDIINERDIDTEKKLTKAFSEHIFKAILLLLYLQEDQYINYLNESVNAYIDFIEQHKIVEKTKDVKIVVETNKQLRIWIEYPKENDSKDIKYHVKGKILFSEINQPRIYIKIMNDEKNPVKISATQDWLYLAETIMDHCDVTDKEKRKKLGREGWKYKYSVNEDAVKPESIENTTEDTKVEENKIEDTKIEKVDETKVAETKINENKLEENKKTESNNSKVTKASIDKMKVPELKKYLKDNNLSCLGKKDELKQRLIQHYNR